MADQLTTNPNAPRDWAGDIVPGALLYAYASGTTTPLTVYADAAATIPHPSPIEADGNGVFPQIFYTGAVKIIVTDPDGVALPGFPLDPAPRSVTDTSGANTISFLPTAAIPFTNVQAAIEHVDGNFGAFGQTLRETETASGARTALELGAAALLGVSGSGDFTVDPASVANRATTKAVIDASIAAVPRLGDGQTYQTPARVGGTAYQNTTGRTIFVCLRASEASGARLVEVSPDNFSTAVTVGTFQASSESIHFPVPAGWYYRINGSCTITFWSELR